MFLNFQNFTSQVLKKPKNLTSVSYKTVSYKNRMRVPSDGIFYIDQIVPSFVVYYLNVGSFNVITLTLSAIHNSSKSLLLLQREECVTTRAKLRV